MNCSDCESRIDDNGEEYIEIAGNMYHLECLLRQPAREFTLDEAQEIVDAYPNNAKARQLIEAVSWIEGTR